MTQKVLVIGAASAYYLRKKGWQVSMVDQGHFDVAHRTATAATFAPAMCCPF